MDELYADVRKASENALQLQQEMSRHWTQWLLSLQQGAGPTSGTETVQKRWQELLLEMLQKQREFVDSTYQAATELVEQASRTADAKSPEEYRHLIDELGDKTLTVLKDSSAARLHEFQAWSERTFELGKRHLAM